MKATTRAMLSYLLKNHYKPYSQNWYRLTPLAHGLTSGEDDEAVAGASGKAGNSVAGASCKAGKSVVGASGKSGIS